MVPLTRNLPTLIRAVEPAFDRRIQAAFPLGSSDRAMGVILQGLGFARQDWTTQPENEHWALREEHRSLCVFDYSVY